MGKQMESERLVRSAAMDTLEARVLGEAGRWEGMCEEMEGRLKVEEESRRGLEERMGAMVERRVGDLAHGDEVRALCGRVDVLVEGSGRLREEVRVLGVETKAIEELGERVGKAEAARQVVQSTAARVETLEEQVASHLRAAQSLDGSRTR